MEYSHLSKEDLVTELYRRFRCTQYENQKTVLFLGVPGAGNLFIFRLKEREPIRLNFLKDSVCVIYQLVIFSGRKLEAEVNLDKKSRP